MTRKNPWKRISIPQDESFNVLKDNNAAKIKLHWGKNQSGNCLFIIELEGNQQPQFRKHKVSIRGIKIDLKNITPTHPQRIVITLDKQIDQDLFCGLCSSLIEVLSKVSDQSATASVVLIQIKRWKSFMSGDRPRIMTPEEVRGLFAELHLLRFLYSEKMSQKQAVESWLGPIRSHQDFIFGDTAIESKSISGRERNSVTISSEDQMDSDCANLYLMVYKLIEKPKSGAAKSLNELILQILKDIIDPDVECEFQDRLAKNGYIDIPDYDEPRFTVTGDRTYKKNEGFPCIVRSKLPYGITKVKYDILLESLKDFLVDKAEI